MAFLQVRQVKAVITRICGEFESRNKWNLEKGKEGHVVIQEASMGG
jgi:hypothetical protein